MGQHYCDLDVAFVDSDDNMIVRVKGHQFNVASALVEAPHGIALLTDETGTLFTLNMARTEVINIHPVDDDQFHEES